MLIMLGLILILVVNLSERKQRQLFYIKIFLRSYRVILDTSFTRNTETTNTTFNFVVIFRILKFENK
jgi:hypothetical protein